jgi:hypothetical protein
MACSIIRENIFSKGYSIIEHTSLEQFHTICACLGQIKQSLNVKLTDGKSQFPYIRDEIPFHTDNPTINIVAWFCVNQDETDGSSYLLDARKLLLNLSDTERDELSKLNLPAPNTGLPNPLLQTTNDQPHLFFIHRLWNEIAESNTSVVKNAILHFLNLVSDARETKKYEMIRLAPNQSLFINNYFMLHARAAISNHSKRFLVRNYIDNKIE